MGKGKCWWIGWGGMSNELVIMMSMSRRRLVVCTLPKHQQKKRYWTTSLSVAADHADWQASNHSLTKSSPTSHWKSGQVAALQSDEPKDIPRPKRAFLGRDGITGWRLALAVIAGSFSFFFGYTSLLLISSCLGPDGLCCLSAELN